MSVLKFDYSMSGFSPEYLSRFASTAASADKELANCTFNNTDWLDYPVKIEQTVLLDILNTAEEIKRKCDALIVIGIGGSYMGAKAGLTMIKDSFNAKEGCPEVYFAGWNMSSVYHAEVMKAVKNKDVCVIVISKSGTTIETAAAFKIFRYFLFEKYGDDYVNRIYVVTSSDSGALHEEAVQMGYKAFALPENIGGRYSVLTPSGLLPLACAGIDVLAMMKGAKAAYDDINSLPYEQNDCYKYAVLRRLMDLKGKKIEVFAGWEPRLEYFTDWLIQLFGESEGKDGKGLYPAQALFTRDLHSFGQFLQQGTPQTFETMFSIATPTLDISYEGDKSYAGTNSLIEQAVSIAHSESNTPVMRFTFDNPGAEAFGYGVYFFMRACAISCVLLGVNPFDQPGVEAYKDIVKKLSE